MLDYLVVNKEKKEGDNAYMLHVKLTSTRKKTKKEDDIYND